MKSFPFVIAFVSFVALAAACGGKSKGAAGPAGPSEGDDAATPFNDGAVKAALAGTPGVEACGVDASTTMGAHIAAQKDMLKSSGGEGDVVQESFMCRAQGGGKWECEWSVSSRPAAPSPDDPCGGDGGAGYVIVVGVSDNGTLAPDSINCVAPG